MGLKGVVNSPGGKRARVLATAGFSANAQQFFNRLVTQPPAAQKTLYAALIDGLTADGDWANLDALYCFSAQDSSTARVNLVQNKWYLARYGSPSFDLTGLGYTATNSTNDYQDTEYSLATYPGMYTQNSASVGVAITVGPGAGVDSGVVSGTPNTIDLELYSHYLDNKQYGSINSGSEVTGTTNASNTGVYAMDRQNSTASQGYKDGTQNWTTATASRAGSMTIAILKGGVTPFKVGSAGAAFFGASLGAAGQSRVASRINTFTAGMNGITGSADLITLGGTTSTVINDGAFNVTPGLCKLNNGNLFCIWSACSDSSQVDGVWKYAISTNSGSTWSAPTTLYTPSVGWTAVDVECMVMDNGSILITGMVQKNSDSTQNVIGAIVGASDASSFGSISTFQSSLYPGAGTFTSSKPIQMANNTIILGTYGNSGGGLFSAGVISSTDRGVTWGNAATMIAATASEQYDEANGVQFASGRLVYIVRHDESATSTSRGYVQTHSDDNGATWSAPINVYSGNAGIATPGRPAVVQPTAGQLHMWIRAASPTISRWSWSINQGITWAPFIPYSNDSQQYWYASSTVIDAHNFGSIVSRAANSTSATITYQSFAH